MPRWRQFVFPVPCNPALSPPVRHGRRSRAERSIFSRCAGAADPRQDRSATHSDCRFRRRFHVCVAAPSPTERSLSSTDANCRFIFAAARRNVIRTPSIPSPAIFSTTRRGETPMSCAAMPSFARSRYRAMVNSSAYGGARCAQADESSPRRGSIQIRRMTGASGRRPGLPPSVTGCRNKPGRGGSFSTFHPMNLPISRNVTPG